MSHQTSKDKWNSLTQRQREEIWNQTNGTRLIPNQVSGSDLDKLFKKINHEQISTNIGGGPDRTSLGGDMPD